MKVVQLKSRPNQNALELIDGIKARIESGEIESVAVVIVDCDSAISGEVSSCKNKLLLWAAAEHMARTHYANILDSE